MARTNRKTILILGGGVGGIVTANELNKRLGNQHRVVIIDKGAQYLYTPSLVWVMAGRRRPEQLTKDLRRMTQPEVEVLQAEVQEINPDGQHVTTSAGEIGYDYLVMSLGADTAPGNMHGYEDAAHNFFDLEGAARLGQALERFERGQIVVAISSLPYKCPAAPYEAALLIDDVLRRRGVRDRVGLQVFTP